MTRATSSQLFRYLSGTLSPATGDQACNTGNPSVTRICFVNNTSAGRHAVLPVLHPAEPGAR